MTSAASSFGMGRFCFLIATYVSASKAILTNWWRHKNTFVASAKKSRSVWAFSNGGQHAATDDDAAGHGHDV
jgi:hypothetical protein